MSASLTDLLPSVQEKAQKFLRYCIAVDLDVRITSTYRSNDEQAALYAKGRTVPGDIVTNAKPGQSWHNWRCAFDFVVRRNGQPAWNTKDAETNRLWQLAGALGEQAGLEWGGRWANMRGDLPHLQYRGGLTLAQVQSGEIIK